MEAVLLQIIQGSLQLICFANENSLILSYSKALNKIFSIPLKAQCFTVLSEIFEENLETFFCYREQQAGFLDYQFKDVQPSKDNKLLLIKIINKFLLLDVNQTKLIQREFFDLQCSSEIIFLSNFIQVRIKGQVSFISLKRFKIEKKICTKRNYKLDLIRQQEQSKSYFQINESDLVQFQFSKYFKNHIGILWNLVQLKLIRKISVKNYHLYQCEFIGLTGRCALFQMKKSNRRKAFYHAIINIINMNFQDFVDEEEWVFDKLLLKLQISDNRWKAQIKI